MANTDIKEIQKKIIYPNNYLIANLDVLGIQNKMLKSDEKKRIVVLSLLNQFIEEAKNGNEATKNLAREFDTICFSDNIIVAYNTNQAKNQDDYIHKCHLLILYVMALQAQALSHGFLLRGAIKFGELFIDKHKNFTCGKGLVETYKQESELSIYPRIITTDQDLLKIIDTIILENSFKITNIFVKDFDAIYYLDYLQLFDMANDLNKILSKVKNIYETDLYKERNINEKIKQKHNWHINYFNSFCERYRLPQYKIEVK